MKREKLTASTTAEDGATSGSSTGTVGHFAAMPETSAVCVYKKEMSLCDGPCICPIDALLSATPVLNSLLNVAKVPVLWRFLVRFFSPRRY